MKFLKIILSALILAATISSCKEDRPTLQPPGSKLEGINATFELYEVSQVDELTLSFNKERDVTAAFLGTNPGTITFDSENFTYSVEANDSPNYLGTEGTWAFDDNEFPTMITLNTSDGRTLELPMLATIRPQDQHLKFMLTKSCNGETNLSYKYNFKRQ